MSEPDDNCDASLAGDGRFEEALKRVSYEPGMLLGLEATRAEQDYHRRRATRHGYWLHGAGTVAGLRVSIRAEDPGNDADNVRVRLVVSPGVGVDGLGREIGVPEPYCVDLGAWLTAQHEDEELWGALIRDGYAEADNLLWLKVTMRYQDCPSGLQPVLATEVNAGTDPVQPSRVADCVLFELVAERPDDVSAEEHLFAAHSRIKAYDEIPALELVPVLGDVCDESAVDNAFSSYRPQVIFHAAAYKHVPLLQVQARETVKNNVLGTALVAAAADRLQAEAFVLISTDKAVNPTSMMGASKRIAEMYCQAIAGTSQTRFITVRFGNVLGSAGSVVPLFNRQIASGGPVTVTHPEVTRYFMTIAEASQLILQASVIGGHGEIFVLNMGEPIKIAYLARQMIQLAGKVPDEDVRIVYTGLRPGEKMAEELFHSDESLSDTGFDKLLLAHSRRVSRDAVMTLCAELEDACAAFDYARIEDVVRRLVPEYGTEGATPDEETRAAAPAAGTTLQAQGPPGC